jgi:glyoxylase I family protein
MARGIPGLRGTEHIGFTVPDLEQAHSFFVDVIGCEYLFSLGPFRHDDDDWMLTHLNVDPRTVMVENRFYRCRYGPNFEIFHYESADAAAPEPRNSDIGGHHLAFYVDDLDAAIEYLRSREVTILEGPTESSSHNLGQRWIYFLSPWGMQFELVSYPNGKQYEAAAATKLWHPAHPSE